MLFLLVVDIYSAYCTTYTWLSSTIAPPPMKRAAAIGIANTFANCTALYGNYFWLDQYGPTFVASWGCIVAFICLSLACIVTLRITLLRKNASCE